MEKPAVVVDNVSMKFNLSKEKVDSLKDYVIKFLKKEIKYNEFWALQNVDFEVKKGDRVGILGLNGAGKSTLLRIMAGIIRQDRGEVLMDEEPVFENERIKEHFFYIPDDAYIPANYNALDMAEFYRCIYPGFQQARFETMMKQFHLDGKRKISTFSKGMKKQLLVILGISTGTKYLFCDETFDGLDPVMRQAVKSIFASEIMSREFTPVIASHNLRELEDICDHIGLLHQGGILLSRDLEDMKFHIHKIQCVLTDKKKEEELKILVLSVKNEDILTQLQVYSEFSASHGFHCRGTGRNCISMGVPDQNDPAAADAPAESAKHPAA